MGLPEGVTTVAGRIATFEGPHHLTKRRASSAKMKTATTVSWPHTSPLPEEFARAGFFYKPGANSPDNVMCFVCQKQLDGWEPGDNPAVEHLTHVPDCGWAINVCIGQRNDDPNRVEEDPMDPKLVEARKATFLDSWPHENKKGWKCKTKKMVEAGWCYDPSPEYDDGVTCFYCNLSLDGWEPKDDPMEEHRKRSPDCYFFSLLEEYGGVKKARGKKGRSSRTSKASRLSTQSNLTTFSEAPSLMSFGDDVPAEGDSGLTTATVATTTSTTGKGRKTAAKAKTGAKGTRKGTRTKKATPAASFVDDEQMDEAPVIEAEDMVVQEAPKPRRGTRRNTQLADDSHLDRTSIVETTSQPRRATRTKKAKPKEKPRVSEDESQLQSELLAAVEASIQDEGTPKPARGTKRTSDGVPKIDSSILLPNEPPSQIELQPPKAKRGRKPTKTKEPALPRSSEVPDADEPMPEPKPKPVPKGKKGKKATKPEHVEPEADEHMSVDIERPAMPGSFSPPRSSLPQAAGTPLERPETPNLTPAAPSPAPSTPTPAKAAAPSATVAAAAAGTPTLPARKAQKSTPSPSPPSSDVENQPPSSRPPPSSNRHTTRIPLAASTPTASPSKRLANTTLGGLTSTYPWQPTDLETVFLPSPNTARFLRLDGGLDTDGEVDIDIENGDEEKGEGKEMGGLEAAVKRVKARLTSPEKKMTVQEWVDWNARRGEERLRRECERLVGVFETEGGRALRVLEGIEVV